MLSIHPEAETLCIALPPPRHQSALGLSTCSVLLPLRLQIASTVIGGGRLEVPPVEQLPVPDRGALPGLDGYLALMRDCWEASPVRRPSFADIVPRVR